MLAEQQLAMRSVDRTATSLGANLAAFLAVCSIAVPASAKNPMEITIAAVPRTSSFLEAQQEIDELLLKEIVGIATWLANSQLTLDQDAKAALYEDRWDHYL